MDRDYKLRSPFMLKGDLNTVFISGKQEFSRS